MFTRLSALACLAVGLSTIGSSAHAAGGISAWAPPGAWGVWQQLASQISGPITYKITAEPVGSTAVVGQVAYVDETGKEHIMDFHKDVTFRTGNYSHWIRVRFKGFPLVTVVAVTITP